jgi:hypothetical protein
MIIRGFLNDSNDISDFPADGSRRGFFRWRLAFDASLSGADNEIRQQRTGECG